MTSFIGMDVAAIRALANQMQTAGTDIAQHADQLNGSLEQAQWVGTDANNFRSDWTTHYTNLKNIAQALGDASKAASGNADQQEQASA